MLKSGQLIRRSLRVSTLSRVGFSSEAFVVDVERSPAAPNANVLSNLTKYANSDKVYTETDPLPGS